MTDHKMKVTSADASFGVIVDGENWLISLDTINYDHYTPRRSAVKFRFNRFDKTLPNGDQIVERRKINLVDLIEILRNREDNDDDR